MHPAEIAREIKTYDFFNSFDEPTLLLLATMMNENNYSPGEKILSAGQINNQLYFLRSGKVQVFVDNENVSQIVNIGDIFGEMSVLSGKPVSAELVAEDNVRCFALSAEDLEHVHPSQKDHFQYLLYKIYSVVLSERLKETNKKAKMYESTSRELEKAKRELENVTSAQMSFMRRENLAPTANVLLIESNKKQQNIIKSTVGGTGVHLQIANSIDEAKSMHEQTDFQVIFCDETATEFLEWQKSQKFSGQIVLLHPLDMNFDLLQSLSFVQNVISRDADNRSATVRAVLTTLSKIIHHDYFGIEKYLSWGAETKEKILSQSEQREPYREEMLEYFKSLGIRSAILDRIKVVAEEIMMNAVYDAPTDTNGKSIFNHLPRTTPVHLNAEQSAKLRYACDGNWIAVSVQDPFGSLTRDTVLQYLKSCYSGQAGSLNAGKGGAGRGLHQILESSSVTIFNVKNRKKTEVISLIEIDNAARNEGEKPHFQFFFQN